MKVLHVISDSNIGGAGVLLSNLLSCFDSSTVKSTVALPCGSRLAARLLELDVPVLYLNEPCERISVSSVWELARIIGGEVTESGILAARELRREYGQNNG